MIFDIISRLVGERKGIILNEILGRTLKKSDLGNVLVCGSSVNPAELFALPELDSNYIGSVITFVQAGTSGITVATSRGVYIGSEGVTALSSSLIEPCTITLQLVSTTLWAIISAFGTWTAPPT
jgi:hypothetical protein